MLRHRLLARPQDQLSAAKHITARIGSGCCAILKPMEALTRRLWDEQDRHPGDRLRLFTAVGELIGDVPVLYPGSFVDVAASFVFDSVTYVDNDRRAARFFADTAGVDAIISHHRQDSDHGDWRFIGADYRTDLDLADRVSWSCWSRSMPGSFPSIAHGICDLEAGCWSIRAMATQQWRRSIPAIASLRWSTQGLASTRSPWRDLDSYMIPKRPTEVTAELLHRTGRGVAYTRSPFAYLFERTKN